MIKSIDDINFEGKKVLVRADLNVPLNDANEITDDNRIRASLPTIDKIIDDGGIPIVMSHLGRPKGEYNEKYSLKPVADYFNNKLGYNCIFSEDSIGEKPKDAIKQAQMGDIVLLENLRFHPGEKKNDEDFAKKLSELADVYVNDAFGTAHRAHASTYAVARLFNERFSGYLLMSEIDHLGKALTNPKKPFVAVIGGAKISGKIDVISNLMDKCNTIMIGGGMMFTFYKAMGYEVGKSILEEDRIEMAAELMKKADEKGINLLLPVDVIVGQEFADNTAAKVVDAKKIEADKIGLDIGPVSQSSFAQIIETSKTAVWNGPMGVFEFDNFAHGTLKIAKAMAKATENGGITIIGGGDSAAAIKKMGYAEKVSHVSTGGGASLEFLEGKTLPALEALEL